jgi:dynein heavy chain
MLKDNLHQLQVLIDRGEKLVQGLAGEKTRWEAQIIDLDEQYQKLIGDSILSAAFMSYCGPFPSEYRDDLISNWINMVQSKEIPYSHGFNFADFVADPAQQRQW